MSNFPRWRLRSGGGNVMKINKFKKEQQIAIKFKVLRD
jgi:hypothetical protein